MQDNNNVILVCSLHWCFCFKFALGFLYNYDISFGLQIFFVMRKKFNHVSKLHVIHHGIMPMSVWFGVKFTPGKLILYIFINYEIANEHVIHLIVSSHCCSSMDHIATIHGPQKRAVLHKVEHRYVATLRTKLEHFG